MYMSETCSDNSFVFGKKDSNKSKNTKEDKPKTKATEKVKFICPECKSDNMVVDGHCAFCRDCGWSLCSM